MASQNNHMAVIAKSDAIKKDIERNKARKLEIQQLLATNAAELQQYNNLIDLNLKEQEAARGDIVNMRVALEAVKERMNKIEEPAGIVSGCTLSKKPRRVILSLPKIFEKRRPVGRRFFWVRR